jgi:urease accessory protein
MPRPARMGLALLTDGRLPSGAYAHSAGIEVAVARKEVANLADLERFLLGRAWTTGLVDASFAAWVAARAGESGELPWADVDVELSARIASRTLRATSRRLGRQLVNVAVRIWPSPALDLLGAGPSPHHAVALGAVASSAGLRGADAAFVAVHGTITTPAHAALRLLGLDPVALHALLARLGDAVEAVVEEATAAARGWLDQLPCAIGPASELAAEEHAERSPRLFAS